MSCKRTARRPPTKLRVTIESLAYGGDGVAHDEGGRVVFVPATAPGDAVARFAASGRTDPDLDELIELDAEVRAWAETAQLAHASRGGNA